MAKQVDAGHVRGVFDVGESGALHRIYSQARLTIGGRIEIDEEIERRLAVIVLYTFADEALSVVDEGAIARTCVDRLMARTSTA